VEPVTVASQWLSGTLYCLVGALAYTAANICMRQLTTLECDPSLAVFGREFFTTILAGPCVLAMTLRQGRVLPVGRLLGQLLLAALLLQVVGNLCGQWSLGIVGLSVNIPAFFGVTVIGAGVLGRVCLGEPVTRRSACAMAILLLSLMLLGLGAEKAGQAIAADRAIPITASILVLAVLAAGVSGGTSAVLSITVRHSMTQAVTPLAVAFLVPLVGALSLGSLIVFRQGWFLFLNTPSDQWMFMAAAGGFNFIGFVSFITGLKRTSVVYANAVSASQVAMAAMAGMVLFHEPPNPWLILGVSLTIAGILSFDRPADGGEV
jgi:drug/metabolite transporter (DMT)-like permease